MFLTDSAKQAHVVLPTTAFGEEQVTFTSTERRIQLANQAVDPPPGVMPAWQQITAVAARLGADWHYDSAAEIMAEIGEVVPFYGGASYANLERDYGRQWPCPKDKPLGTRFLFEDGFGGARFKFVPVTRPAPAEAPGAGGAEAYPMVLVFGHSLYYWNQNVLIKHSQTLQREYRILLLDYPNGFVEINDEDARRLGIRDGEAIGLQSATGAARTWARVTGEVRPGTVFAPYFVPEVQRRLLPETRDGGAQTHTVMVRLEKA